MKNLKHLFHSGSKQCYEIFMLPKPHKAKCIKFRTLTIGYFVIIAYLWQKIVRPRYKNICLHSSIALKHKIKKGNKYISTWNTFPLTKGARKFKEGNEIVWPVWWMKATLTMNKTERNLKKKYCVARCLWYSIFKAFKQACSLPIYFISDIKQSMFS